MQPGRRSGCAIEPALRPEVHILHAGGEAEAGELEEACEAAVLPCTALALEDEGEAIHEGEALHVGDAALFFEDRRGLIATLLDRVLPPESIDATVVRARGFESRYGLRCKPALVRFGILDRRLRLRGLSDLTVPVEDLAEIRLGARRAFVTENEINGLAFPELPGSIVMFGMGYRAELLAGIGWLADVDIHYWGDIDTHGFGILDRLRGAFPRARSFLMDRAIHCSRTARCG